ncbi:phosphatase 2C-like domain-containing protein [Syncephalis pseudoplumigaleata]|uniref:Protein phosphatase n=1 Tax=Syncephalis pseudoplumigaleata TaxID=1712513 RepID=A0A4P9YY24_9FUNG|nr:phosphatase 2C-like domain-containing protein [Syncephalis pseudoplumigaleata]|eukprot:RKP25043.1 phosphatase 2C-like domain-containing protein [Syncephalis pseudoplumigaleata]
MPSTVAHTPSADKVVEGDDAAHSLLPTLRRRVDAGGDAFFCATDYDAVALGVADGVSESAKYGGHPAEFSWLMMEMASDRFHEIQRQRRAWQHAGDHGPSAPSVVDARELLEGAYEKMLQRSPIITGSSTVCLLTLCQETGILDSATLGDSGYAVFRDSRLHHRSAVQQHRFNYPYQLSVRMKEQPALSGEEQYTASPPASTIEHGPILPRDAAADSHQLQDGDLVLLASDGLMDNMHEDEVIQVLETEPSLLLTGARQWNADLEDALCRVAWRLAQTAWTLSQDPRRLSPWAQSARNIDAINAMGG